MILTDEEIRKAAEFAAEQMWPESGYVGWTEDDAVFHRKFIEACFEKLRGGVELPKPMGYLCDWGNDSYGLTHQTVYYGEPGSSIEDDWNCHPTVHKNTQLFTRDQLLAYGAAQRLAGQQWKTIESAPKGANNYSFMRLAWGPEEDKVTGEGMHANGKFYAVAIFYEMGQERKYVFREIEVEPTHWQPLPHPPASPQEQT